jgi:uncharacterized protein (TIGR00290 family)
MKHKTPVVLAWSGGKDSSYALHQLLSDERYEIRYLLSTINGENRRLSMHGVREELIEAQAKSIGIPLLKVYVYEGTNWEYEQQMSHVLLKVKATGIHTIAFGDIFLEDLRIYREEKMKQIGMNCLFPIWKKDTYRLVKDFITKGFKTYICCVNDGFLNESWCGRLIDEIFLKELPPSVDPCGENGEFHSFCFEGPLFKKPLSIVVGEKVYKPLEINNNDQSNLLKGVKTKGFWFCDLR